MKRREFIKSTGLLGGTLGLTLNSPLNVFQSNLAAAEAGAFKDKKMIFIFQRGGNDGLNTVIPRGRESTDYNTTTRPTLYIPENLAIDLGNGFAQLHPQMLPIMDIYNKSSLNGLEGPGNLAVIHRVGYSGQSRSHFSSQQYWENGLPGNEGLEEGMFYRYLSNCFDFDKKENNFLAAAISGSQMVSLKGPEAIPNFRRASDFSFEGNANVSRKLLGEPVVNGKRGKGILGLYSGTHDFVGKKYRPLVHNTGELLGATMETLQSAVDQGAYTPTNGAVYAGDLGNKLEQCAMLLKRTDVKILGVNIGGWDTHNNQGQVNGRHGNLLNQIADGYQALHRDLQDMWDDLIIVTMTEFGRTSLENDSRGTDHAEATTMFVAGGGVNGGVYNCDASSWEANAIRKVNNRYLSHKTDFRSVFGEIFTKHFGVDSDALDEIIPAYSIAKFDDPNEFENLNFL